MNMINSVIVPSSPALQPDDSQPGTSTVDIVVISLPSATKRRDKIREMFEGTGLKWRYFDAHTSLQQPGLSYDISEVRKSFGRSLSAPEIAVCSSHVAVLSDFLQTSTSDYVLVLEDDVIFDTGFSLERFSAFCREKGLHYVRLFGKHYAEAVHLGFFFDRSIIRYKTSPAGAQAYLISRHGVQLFLQSFQSIDETVDIAIDRFWKTGLPIYSIFPYPIIERYSPTSIPMPARTTELDRWQTVARFFNRARAKSSKIVANFRRRPADREMKRQSANFRQIFDA